MEVIVYIVSPPPGLEATLLGYNHFGRSDDIYDTYIV